MDEMLLRRTQPLIDQALREDLGEWGDVTTLAIGVAARTARAELIGKSEGVLAGLDLALQVFTTVSPAVTCERLLPDGARISPKSVLARLSGPADGLLIAERTALNFLGRLSGIASLTRKFVDAIEGTKAKVLDTRKTTPGWRELEKYAVRCGGGQNHRMGLHDMILIKDNHLVAAGGITPAVNKCRQFLSARRLSLLIEVEVKNGEELREAVELAVDRILLDNMDVDQLRECVRYVDGRVPLEASGNVTLETVRRIAETGVDFISSGALTHSARTLDVSLEFVE